MSTPTTQATPVTPPTEARPAGTTRPQFRVVMPLIQIQGHLPALGSHEVHERTLRHGDVVPDWVPAAEVDRLAAGGFIEAQP